jgi:Glycosyl hydrolase family 30 beta sandwich domain
VDDVAFINPDGSKVLVAYNNSLSAKAFAVVWHGKSVRYTLPASGTVTFTWRLRRRERATAGHRHRARATPWHDTGAARASSFPS